jgi:hypothetical protein
MSQTERDTSKDARGDRRPAFGPRAMRASRLQQTFGELFQPQRFECRIDVLEMSIERAEPIDFL